MKNFVEKNAYVPRFMSCSCHEEPELNYIIHCQSPKLLVEIIEDYGSEELNELKKETVIFKEVKLSNGETDLLVLADIFDKEYFNGKTDDSISKKLEEIFLEMSIWYIDEMADLDNYE